MNTRRTFRVVDGSEAAKFLQSRTKLRVFGGGYGNGKTASAAVLAIQLAKDYPGSNGLIARETKPKLMDTIMAEFKVWCPDNWVKSFPQSVNSPINCTLKNGSVVNFRYIAQQGKGKQDGSTTSNLLSATYDWIIVDQIEDPQITEKDYKDLLGRLRGNTPYAGDDPTMPTTGPRWMILTTNPTRNWVYRKFKRPLERLEKGIIDPDLVCLRDENGEPLLDENGQPSLMIELFEAPTYANRHNLGEDFIQMLESEYHGSMRDRFLLGQWAAYEGLVYWMQDETVHMINHGRLVDYFNQLVEENWQMEIVEGYDHGLAVQSCYLFGFVDPFGNIIYLDGFYDKEQSPEESARKIKKIRYNYLGTLRTKKPVLADPAIFKRGAGDKKVVGRRVSDMFLEEGIVMRAGNNDIMGGIAKVQSYLIPQKGHLNPITGDFPSPYMYYSDELTFLSDEFGSYYWQKDTDGESEDKPQDRRDHGMDTIKYTMTDRPKASEIIVKPLRRKPSYMCWHEQDAATNKLAHRYQ